MGPGRPPDTGDWFIMSRLAYSGRILHAFSAMCIFLTYKYQICVLLFKSIKYSAYFCKKGAFLMKCVILFAG